MDIKEIKSLIQFLVKIDISEIKLHTNDIKIYIKKQENIKDIYHTNNYSSLDKSKKTKSYDKCFTIKSPMIGTFYNKPSPDKKPFVKIGDHIDIGTTVCIIEAMKLFNYIESEVRGTLVKILVQDSTPVDYDQPLFILEPD